MSITCLNEGEHYFHLSVRCRRKPELSWVRGSLDRTGRESKLSACSSFLTPNLHTLHLCLPRCLHSGCFFTFPPLSSYPACLKNIGLVHWTTPLLECLLFDGNCNTELYLRNDSSGKKFPETLLAKYPYDEFSIMLSHLQTTVSFIERFPWARHHTKHSFDAIPPPEGKH